MGNPRGGRGLIVGSPWGSGVDFGIPVGVEGALKNSKNMLTGDATKAESASRKTRSKAEFAYSVRFAAGHEGRCGKAQPILVSKIRVSILHKKSVSALQ